MLREPLYLGPAIPWMTKKWRTLWVSRQANGTLQFFHRQFIYQEGGFSIAVSDLKNCNSKPLLAKGKDKKRRLLHVPSLLLRLACKQMTVSSADFIGVPTLDIFIKQGAGRDLGTIPCLKP